MTDALIVSLEEFAELCGVTGETMRAHLKDVGRAGDVPAWLVERGDRGRAYKIEATGGMAWWKAKRAGEEAAEEDRRGRLAQLRLEIVGEPAGDAEGMTLSGRQRRDEIAAAVEQVKYRRLLGQLVEKADLDRALSAAAVELRRALQRVAPEFGIAAGLDQGQVRKLDGMIERAADQFVAAIERAHVAG